MFIERYLSNPQLIAFASAMGDKTRVAALLESPDVDPSVMQNLPLHLACDYGHIEIVDLLINHPRFKMETLPTIIGARNDPINAVPLENAPHHLEP